MFLAGSLARFESALTKSMGGWVPGLAKGLPGKPITRVGQGQTGAPTYSTVYTPRRRAYPCVGI